MTRRVYQIVLNCVKPSGEIFDYSLKATSLVLLNDGSSTESIANAASASKVALIGRCKKTIGSPRDSSMARRRYSSIRGPRIYANNIGAGSAPSLEKT